MLKLTIKPGEFIDIGKDIRVVYSGGSNGNIHLLIDAPRELNIVRSKVLAKNSAAKASSEKKKDYNVGDIVNFHGGTHYVSSYPGSKGYKARAGKAKITIKNGSGKAHPWHLIHTDSGSNVYGWVDDGTFD